MRQGCARRSPSRSNRAGIVGKHPQWTRPLAPRSRRPLIRDDRTLIPRHGTKMAISRPSRHGSGPVPDSFRASPRAGASVAPSPPGFPLSRRALSAISSPPRRRARPCLQPSLASSHSRHRRWAHWRIGTPGTASGRHNGQPSSLAAAIVPIRLESRFRAAGKANGHESCFHSCARSGTPPARPKRRLMERILESNEG